MIRRWFWAITSSIALVYAVAGVYIALSYIPGRRADLESRWRAALTIQADDRKAAIEQWTAREMAEATLLASYPAIQDCLGARGCPPGHHADSIMAHSAAALGYRDIRLYDRLARVVASSGAMSADTVAAALARQVRATGASRFDMSRNGQGGPEVELAVATGAPRPTGVVVVSLDPERWLYQLLQLPLETRTGEALLARRIGPDVQFISPLRYDTASPMTKLVPMARGSLAVVTTLERAAVDGSFRDYRGEAVLAAGRRIAGTPWALVVKMDRAEAFEGLRASIARVILVWVSLAAAVGALLTALWWGLRREAEAARSRTTARFAEVLDHAPDAILVIGPDDRVIDANRQALALSGLERAALIGRHAVDDLRPPEMREAGRAQRTLAKEAGEAVYETHFLASSGERIPVEVSVRAYDMGDEQVTVAVLRDLRERRASEARLARVNRLLRTTSEVNQLIIRETDPERLLAEVCRIAVEDGRFVLAWIGAKDPSGRVRPLAASGPPGYVDQIEVRWDAGPLAQGPAGRALREQGTISMSTTDDEPAFGPWSARAAQFGVKSSASTPIRVSGKADMVLTLYSTDGVEFDQEIVALLEEMGGDIGFALNTIARSSALEAARAQMARNAAALQQAAEAAIITDASGTIVEVNPAFERITGYHRDEVIGRNPRILKSGKQDAAFYRRMWDVLARGQVFTGEVVNRTKSGATYVAEVAISPVRDDDGRIVNYVGLQRDVTRERALDEQLRQAQKLEAIGHFTGGIAHDFNNLLSVVLANVSLANAELSSGAYQIREYLRDIEQATLRGSAMVRKMLAFGRRERLAVAAVNLGTAATELVQVLRRVVPESIEIRCDVAEGLPAAKADVGAFEQIIVNLATNARDAMPDGGTFQLHVGRETVADAGVGMVGRPGDYVVVSATDTGTGMEAGTMARIFEPFFTTKEVGHGTGLGLAMVFGIMQQHKGFVRVESEPGKGTTFRLYFPAAARAASDVAAPAPAPAVAAGRGETILVVEDEALVRLAASRILERHGYRVVGACDGEEGWTRIAELGDTLALVMTDAVMPRLGGPELIARVRDSGSHVPCLITTGYGPGNGEVPASAADRILGKPWKPEELLTAVRELIDGRVAAA